MEISVCYCFALLHLVDTFGECMTSTQRPVSSLQKAIGRLAKDIGLSRKGCGKSTPGSALANALKKESSALNVENQEQTSGSPMSAFLAKFTRKK